MKYDAVIIGSGLGGLTAGATLAKHGKKVLVLEQHYSPGGAATVFERHGIKLEVGLHEMDWGTPDTDMKHIIFKKLGLDKRIQLVQFPQTWEVKTETESYVIPHGRKNVIEYLGNKFPEEKNNLKKYFNDMKWTIRQNNALPPDLNFFQFLTFPITKFPFTLWQMIAQYNAGDKNDSHFKSNKLKNILNTNLAYYSDNPYELSWYYYSSAQYSYYQSAVYVKGGSQELSNALCNIITENGGEVRLMADAQKIELEGNKAVGVTYFDRRTKENITVFGEKIIANTAPQNIFGGKMVPAQFREPRIEKLEPACALWTIYYISKTPMHQKFPGLSYSTFLNRDSVIDANQKDWCDAAFYGNEPGCVLVDYTVIDSGLVPEGDTRGTGVLCGLQKYEDWDGLSKEDYKAKKEQFTQQMLDYVERYFPGFKDNLEYVELATPKTNERYLRTPKGTAYGFVNKKFVFGRSPRTAAQIKNLHYASAWGFPGGGFTGAIISGYYAALDILFPMTWRIILRTISTSVIMTALIEGIILGIKHFAK